MFQESTEPKKPKKLKKKEPVKVIVLPPCFICQKKGNVGLCNNKICNKAYHLRCLKLDEWPEGNIKRSENKLAKISFFLYLYQHLICK